MIICMVINVGKKANLTVEELVEKEFHIDFKGYNAKEVDSFLDFIIEDYQNFDATIKQQQELLMQYETSTAAQAKRILELESKLKLNDENQETFNPVDLLKRVSRLEQALHQNSKSE